jgi:hypothetical protein
MSEAQLTSETGVQKILQFQQTLMDCNEVFAIVIRCDGEESIESLWETMRAAEMCRDEHNNIKGNANGYYGRASIRTMRVKTEKMAVDLYTKEPAT